MMTDKELRKWCIEQAFKTEVFPCDHNFDLAERMYAFVKNEKAKAKRKPFLERIGFAVPAASGG